MKKVKGYGWINNVPHNAKCLMGGSMDMGWIQELQGFRCSI